MDVSRSYPQLQNPPIVEAVLQWVARGTVNLSESEWKCELEKSFPEYQIYDQRRSEFEFQKNGNSHKIGFDNTLEGFRLVFPEKANPLFICQFTKDGIIFSCLQPYQGWSKTWTEAQRFWQKFEELLKPDSVSRIGLRFINQIGAKDLSEVRKKISFGPSEFHWDSWKQEQFFYQDRMKSKDGKYFLSLTRAANPEEGPGEMYTILDVDIYRNEPSDCRTEFETMRRLKNELFFKTVIDAENQFGAKK